MYGVHSRHLRLNRFKSGPPSKESKTVTKQWRGDFFVLEGSASITSGGSDLQIRGGRSRGLSNTVDMIRVDRVNCRVDICIYNHNYNKILKSDWLSTALISALIGQFNRTVRVMPSNWTVRAITRALKWLFFFSLLAKQNFEFLVF